MDDEDFGLLIERYQKGLLRDDEREWFDRWFDRLEATALEDEWTEEDKQKLKRKIWLKIAMTKNTFRGGFDVMGSLIVSLLSIVQLSNSRITAI